MLGALLRPQEQWREAACEKFPAGNLFVGDSCLHLKKKAVRIVLPLVVSFQNSGK